MTDPVDPTRKEDDVDGVIYFDPKDIPEQDILSESLEFTGDETHPYTVDYEVGIPRAPGTLYERRLARWKDVTTAPKTKLKCTKMCGVGSFRTCCRWKAYSKWYYRTATLRITTSRDLDIGAAVEECMKQAAIAAAIAAIISGGSAAAAAAEKMFFSCLSKKLGSDLLGVKIDLTGKWGDWSPV